MASKRHCVICSSLIFTGLFCSTCTVEIHRARTAEDQPFDEWLNSNRNQRRSGSDERNTVRLDNFYQF
ncbi:MAG: nucleotide-binding protein [Thermoplasmataceae archaeon]